MSDDNYLKKVLEAQTLKEDGDELTALRKHRDEVEQLLRKKYGPTPTIRYGGSMAKGTMIKESYDLDVICYFPRDDTSAGDTLKDIFESVCASLQKKYIVEPKTSALRLMDCDSKKLNPDFHIDVVPGRYVDEEKEEVNIHQSSGDKDWLKTNLRVHIEHIRDSGVIDALRLLKLWRMRNRIPIKQFVLDLLVVKLLKAKKSASLTKQITHVLQEFRDHSDDLSVEDPANPNRNDLTGLLDAARSGLSSIASSTLGTLERSGWEAVFTIDADGVEKVAGLRNMVVSAPIRTKPWHQ
jgi:tRNA nucleotidyltransferase (CCA-adding enzyme)